MMTPMALDGILFSEDAEILSTMDRVLESFAIHTRVALSVKEVVSLLEKQTFDVVFIDYKDKATAAGVVRAVRDSKLNHQVLMMTITDEGDALKAAFADGVQLSMPRPKTVDQAMRCLKPSYTFMLQRRRKSIRFDISIPVQLKTGRGSRIKGEFINLSETGVALAVAQDVPVGDKVTLDFQLPDSKLQMSVTGRVVWSSHGKFGVGFSPLTNAEQVALQQWVTEQIRSNNATHPILSMRARMPANYFEVTA